MARPGLSPGRAMGDDSGAGCSPVPERLQAGPYVPGAGMRQAEGRVAAVHGVDRVTLFRTGSAVGDGEQLPSPRCPA